MRRVALGTILAGLVSDKEDIPSLNDVMLAILISSQTIWQDLKYGSRQLWSNPGFAAIAILTLALGIGVNTSIFSLLNALLPRPLAVPNSGGVLAVYRGDDRPCSYPDFVDFQQRANQFSGLAADINPESALDVGASSEVILAEAVSYNYATVLGIQPVLGRWFTAEDERAADFPAVISYRTWHSRFGGDPQAIGKHVRRNRNGTRWPAWLRKISRHGIACHDGSMGSAGPIRSAQSIRIPHRVGSLGRPGHGIRAAQAGHRPVRGAIRIERSGRAVTPGLSTLERTRDGPASGTRPRNFRLEWRSAQQNAMCSNW